MQIIADAICEVTFMSMETCHDASPSAVWSQYISRRRPCIFKSLPKDLEVLPELITRENISKFSVRFTCLSVHVYSPRVRKQSTRKSANKARRPPYRETKQ